MYKQGLLAAQFSFIAARNKKAAHGYSRDHRPDCRQVVVALVLDGDGFPKAHEVTGNTKDEHSLPQMLDSLDRRSGSIAGWPSQPTVIMDRGLATVENLNLLRARASTTSWPASKASATSCFAALEVAPRHVLATASRGRPRMVHSRRAR